MVEKSYFLKLTGYIPENKRKEFEQTFKFVFAQLPHECLDHSLSIDHMRHGYYHFFSLWSSAKVLSNFLNSQEFQVLEGAYDTLGSMVSSMQGELVDIKLFHLL